MGTVASKNSMTLQPWFLIYRSFDFLRIWTWSWTCFRFSRFRTSSKTWHTIADHVQRSFLIVWDRQVWSSLRTYFLKWQKKAKPRTFQHVFLRSCRHFLSVDDGWITDFLSRSSDPFQEVQHAFHDYSILHHDCAHVFWSSTCTRHGVLVKRFNGGLRDTVFSRHLHQLNMKNCRQCVFSSFFVLACLAPCLFVCWFGLVVCLCPCLLVCLFTCLLVVFVALVVFVVFLLCLLLLFLFFFFFFIFFLLLLVWTCKRLLKSQLRGLYSFVFYDIFITCTQTRVVRVGCVWKESATLLLLRCEWRRKIMEGCLKVSLLICQVLSLNARISTCFVAQFRSGRDPPVLPGRLYFVLAESDEDSLDEVQVLSLNARIATFFVTQFRSGRDPPGITDVRWFCGLDTIPFWWTSHPGTSIRCSMDPVDEIFIDKVRASRSKYVLMIWYGGLIVHTGLLLERILVADNFATNGKIIQQDERGLSA